MNGQTLLLLAVGLFMSLVVTVATVIHYQFEQHPASVASGLLWRVENALTGVQDLQAEVTATQFDGSAQPVQMEVRAILAPVPALAVEYMAPEDLSGQIVTVNNDLLSHYMPKEALLIVRRWSGLPLAAVGLAGLDVSSLRTQLEQGVVTARVFDSSASLAPVGLSGELQVEATLASPTQSESATTSEGTVTASRPNLSGVATSPVADSSNPLYECYVVEVRDAKSGGLTETLWINHRTYFVQKVVYYEKDQRVRQIEVSWLQVNQGLTTDSVLTLPAVTSTIRG
jgi:outer membrane lipoprotein-sorting protein